jgi:hypothetical protein
MHIYHIRRLLGAYGAHGPALYHNRQRMRCTASGGAGNSEAYKGAVTSDGALVRSHGRRVSQKCSDALESSCAACLAPTRVDHVR